MHHVSIIARKLVEIEVTLRWWYVQGCTGIGTRSTKLNPTRNDTDATDSTVTRPHSQNLNEAKNGAVHLFRFSLLLLFLSIASADNNLDNKADSPFRRIVIVFGRNYARMLPPSLCIGFDIIAQPIATFISKAKAPSASYSYSSLFFGLIVVHL